MVHCNQAPQHIIQGGHMFRLKMPSYHQGLITRIQKEV